MWKCPQCEVLNDEHLEECEVCFFKRSEAIRQESLPWMCPRCETINEGEVCEVCFLSKSEIEELVYERAREEKKFAADGPEAYKTAETKPADAVGSGTPEPLFSRMSEDEKSEAEDETNKTSTLHTISSFLAVMVVLLFMAIPCCDDAEGTILGVTATICILAVIGCKMADNS